MIGEVGRLSLLSLSTIPVQSRTLLVILNEISVEERIPSVLQSQSLSLSPVIYYYNSPTDVTPTM